MGKGKINRIREAINVRLYTHKSYVTFGLQVLSTLVSIMAIAALIYYHGFPKTAPYHSLMIKIIEASFVFYLLKFIVKVVYEFHPVDYMLANWFETFIMLTIFIDVLGFLILGGHPIVVFFERIGMPGMSDYYNMFIQLYFLMILLMEIGKVSSRIGIFRLGPSGLLSLSFIFLILSGSGFLMLPEMTTHGIRYIDALFTSTSACCVTGLTVKNVAMDFTTKGHTVIMFLVQFGGINIISFATFFATFYKNASGLRYQSIMKDIVSSDISDTRSTLRKVILFSFTIELIGAALLFLSWPNYVYFNSLGQKIYYCVFHAVSGFNNAGFALFSNNLVDGGMRFAYNVQLVIAALIFFGGIGFLVLEDLFSWKRIRERHRIKWKRLTIHSRIALYYSIGLVIAGTLFFFIIERNTSLQEHSAYGAFVVSLFQSVTCRTAGFNSVNFAGLSQATLLFMIFLMYVGASPVSTGGGIKTTTFAVIIKSAIATIRGKKNVEIFRHNISFETIDKAYSIILFSVILIFTSTLLLTLSNPHIPVLHLLFEEVSAFGTVGLSVGITPTLNDFSKYILIASMYIGRIGPLTLAIAVTSRAMYTKYKYPNAQVIIG